VQAGVRQVAALNLDTAGDRAVELLTALRR